MICQHNFLCVKNIITNILNQIKKKNMDNSLFSLNVLLGFLFAFGMLVFYGVQFVRPEVSRNEDIFFTTLGLFYSGILIVHGWRLDPILLFSQVLIITIVFVAGWENIRLRGLLVYLTKVKDELLEFYKNHKE